MTTGTIKWFNPTKGFGFIAPKDGSPDVFLHISALQKAGIDTVRDGQEISYELMQDKGKTCAGNIKLL